MADSIIGIQGKDFVLMAADMTSAYSILKFKTDEDKVMELEGGKLLGIGGPVGDRVQFGDYIDKNLRFMKYKSNGQVLSTEETAHYLRNEVAKSIRKQPVQCNSLLAGCDENEGPRLYWIDYLGTMTKSKAICQGYSFSLTL